MISLEMEDKVLEIKALEIPCSLGQLYDAKTSSLLPRFSLFKRSDIQSRANNVNSAKFEFTEVHNLSDRADSLDVSVELSVALQGSRTVVQRQKSDLCSDWIFPVPTHGHVDQSTIQL